MAVSRDPPVVSRAEPLARLLDVSLSLSRYDLVLAVIPVAFLVATATAALTSLTVEGAVAGASLAGVVAVADALYLNPPVSHGGHSR